jgi:hypothetical protein
MLPPPRSWKTSGVLLGLSGLIDLLAFPAGYLGKEHDDALYVLAAQDLAHGHYRHWFLPGQPPITEFTPGYPALLAPVAFFAGAEPAAFQIYNWLILALCDFAVWIWLKRRHSPETAALLTLFFAASPLVLSRAGRVMPEAAFLACVLAALMLWERGAAWAAGAAALACLMLRPAGLPLAAALAAASLARRRFREAAIIGALPAAGLAGWALWCRSSGGLREVSELAWNYGGAGTLEFVRVASENAVHMAAALGAAALPVSWAEGAAAPWLGGLLLGTAAAGAARALKPLRDADPGDLFFFGSLLMHLLWPWWYDRYWLPLLPFLGSLATRAGARVFAGGEKVPAALLAAFLLWQFLVQGRLWTRRRPADARPELAETYAWIRDHTSSADGFASLFYARDLLYTGRVFGPLPEAGSSAELRRELARRRQRYVLWQNEPDLGFSLGPESAPARRLNGLGRLLDDPSAFRLAHRDETGAARLYETRPLP